MVLSLVPSVPTMRASKLPRCNEKAYLSECQERLEEADSLSLIKDGHPLHNREFLTPMKNHVVVVE